MMLYELNGVWQADIGDGASYVMRLSGTLDENQIGKKEAPLKTRFTRKYTYEGAVRLTRQYTFEAPRSKRVFLEAERARVLRLFIDDKEVPPFGEQSISTPHVFEVTGLLDGTHKLTLVSDNSYPGLPRDAIVNSSAATDETQTNWNGILGYFRLRVEEAVFLSAVRVYPVGDKLTVKAEICADKHWDGMLTVKSEALKEPVSMHVSVEEGISEVVLDTLPLREDSRRWDEEEGNLYELCVSLSNGVSKTVTYGIRDFGSSSEGRLILNGRTIFLRGEANCAVFP